MSQVTESFEVDLTMNGASWACREAVAQIGWNVTKLTENLIEVRRGVGLTRNPSRVEIYLEPLGDDIDDCMVVTLYGWIFGFGPLQKRHLRGEMGRLRNAIEVTARRSAMQEAPGANNE